MYYNTLFNSFTKQIQENFMFCDSILQKKSHTVGCLEELNIQLNKAVKEERFEDAARLRDEILELKKERQTS